MRFVAGSAILLALMFLLIAVTVGPSAQNLKKVRRIAWLGSTGLALLVTAGDVAGLALLLIPTLALYELVAGVAA